MRRYGIAIAIAATVTLFGVSILPAKAQQGADARGISISPLIFELSANPGDKLKHTLKIHNPIDQPVSLLAEARNFVATGEEGQAELTDEDTTFSLADWVTIRPSKQVVPAKASATFDFAINTPLNAEPGGHFGSIVIKTKPTGKSDSGQVSIVQELGSLVLLRIAGDIKEDAKIVSFEAGSGFYEKGPFKLITRLQNSGNVHFKPQGTITIANTFGQQVGTAKIDQRNVLPDSVRRFDSQWDPSGFQIGRYTATASVAYGTTGGIATATTTFWVFPWKGALLLLAVLGGLGFVVWRYRDRFRAAFRALKGK